MNVHRRMLLSPWILSLAVSAASGETLWFDDFNLDSSEIYEVLELNPGRDGTVFAFDYSAVGIPEAPSTVDGGTSGLKFFVNDPFDDTTPVTSGVQIAPIELGDTLAGLDYTLTYDLWMNVNGPLPEGGGGSTEAMMVGVGFDGVVPIEAGATDGTYFTLTGEAGVTTDVRSFTDDGYNSTNADGSPINVASESLEDDYYATIFPGGIDVATLPVQGGQDNQVGVTRQGQMAFQWHQIRVDVRGTEARFYVDDLLIAQDQDADIDGTIMVGQADYFSSETDVPRWNFSIVDNLRVITPLTGDFDGSGQLDAADIDDLTSQVARGADNLTYDLNSDNQVDQGDIEVWVKDLFPSWIGDADLDGEFNSSDLVVVLSAGTYEMDQDAVWSTGDFNGDGRTNSSDLVVALSDGGYELGPRAAVAVPEPATGLLGLGAIGALGLRGRRQRFRNRL